MTQPTVGFVLLTHNNPVQVLRLITTLNRLFNYPPIVCHHDFSKSVLPTESLTSNVSFVHPYFKTAWSRFSVLDGMTRAFQMISHGADAPDWVILLSGADYPIKPAGPILKDLASSPYDVHIHHELIQYQAYEREWQKRCYKRYCGIKIGFPALKSYHLTLTYPWVTKFFTPFSKDFRCFAGDFWFCANRKAINYLIAFHENETALLSHYRNLDPFVMSPEESYHHTIFCNASHLQISGDNLRYIDWSKSGPHPKTLLPEDLAKLQTSPAHFARKFDIRTDEEILDQLDRVIA